MQTVHWNTDYFFNLPGKLNLVRKIGSKNVTEANPRVITFCSKNREIRKIEASDNRDLTVFLV